MSDDSPAKGDRGSKGGSGAPTLNDVASLAGVGVMTASRVLSGSAQVRPDKVALVMAAAAELGYRRNENARSLRPGQRSGLIGVIITNASNPYYAEMQLGIEQGLAQHGMRILVGNTNEDSSRERRLVADFIGWQVDGLIVVPASQDTSHLSTLAKVDTPVVLAARTLEHVDLDTVLIDDLGGTRRAVRTLLDEGHRRIAFLGYGMSVSTFARRLRGFQEAHAELDVAVDPELEFWGSSSQDSARRAAEDLLGLSHPATAVFCANNRNTIALMHAIKSVGLSSNASLRVVAFDNFDTADLMPIHLSIVDHDPREMGRVAAEMLVKRLDGHRGPAQRIELTTRFLP